MHNQMREFVKLGHRVKVIVPNGVGKRGRDGKRIGKLLQITNVDGVEICDLRYVTASTFGEKHFNICSAIASIRVALASLTKGFIPDVIHAHTLGFDSEIGYWLKKQYCCPLVVTTHGSDTSIPYEAGKKQELRCFAEKADALVTVSNSLQKKQLDCGVKIPVVTILNGFVLRSAEQNKEERQNRIIQVGNLKQSKRVDVTIRAFSQLYKEFPAMSLTVIGQGEQRKNLELLCQQERVENAVSFLGQLPNDRVFREMCKSRFYVMASKPEGFGIVYLEAMAAGCITIGTEGEGIADLITHGENGFLVPADDPQAIVRIVRWCLSNEHAAQVIAQKGRESAIKLTWETNARRYVELFERVISGVT